MSKRPRYNCSPVFNAKVALAAIHDERGGSGYWVQETLTLTG